MYIALPADINQMPPFVCLLPSLLFIIKQWVTKQGELELKVLIELCVVASLGLGQLPG